MARNSEKAVTALARWRQMQLKENSKHNKDERRPYMTTDEHNVRRAERWRNQVIREIAKAVTTIQNAGLGEFKLRDLNDEINKPLREKSHWEDRIKELGGADYKKIGPKLLDKEGREVPGSKGYKYFGAAKDLPGVKDLFEQEIIATKKSKAEMLRRIDAEYYGYLDDEDHLLLEQERKCELEARQQKIREFKETSHSMDVAEEDVIIEELYHLSDESDEEDRTNPIFANYYAQRSSKGKKQLVKQSDVPSMQEAEAAILEKKKRDLLSIYMSSELQEKEAEVKLLAGSVV